MAPLSEAILMAYKTLIEAYYQIPVTYRNSKLIDGTGGKVSVADLMAYQIGWAKLLIEWYESGLNSTRVVMPGEGFTKWDYVGLANHFYSKYHYDGNKLQIKELEKVVNAIAQIVDKEYALENLEKLGVWQWCTLPSGKKWPLSKWVSVNTTSPYKRATLLIKKYNKQIQLVKESINHQ